MENKLGNKIFLCFLAVFMIAAISVSANGDPGPECSTDADCDYMDYQYCDGNAVYQVEGVCSSGECTDDDPGTLVEDCDDYNDDYCDEDAWVHQTGTCIQSDGEASCVLASSTGLCDDGEFCNGAETCEGDGNCVAGTPPACDDPPGEAPLDCYTAYCDEDADACVYDKDPDNDGPGMSDLVVDPVFNGGVFDFSATAEDECSEIAASEYFVWHTGSVNCGSPGSGTAMDPEDGTFDELTEDVWKEDITFLEDGSNRICTQSMDSEENWGDCYCVYYESDTIPPELLRDVKLNDELEPWEYLVCGENPDFYVTVCDTQSDIQGGEIFIDKTIPPDPLPAPWSGIWLDPMDQFRDMGWHCSHLNGSIDISNMSEGTHYIRQIRGKDIVENWGKIYNQNFNYSFIKDTVSPITYKNLTPAEGKIVHCDIDNMNGEDITDGCAYVKQGTTITLWSYDFNPDDDTNNGYNDLPGEYADQVVIHYKVWWSENGCEWSLDQEGQSNPGEPIDITLDKDSYHLIEYWAEDLCGNEEEHHFELDIVDTEPPVTEKNIIGPQYNDTEAGKFYIDGITEIELICEDPEPHPVGGEEIFYRYRIDEGEGYGDWTDWTEYQDAFSFPEESKHELEYYCIDDLDNEEVHKFEIDYVDHTAPNTTKTYSEPFVRNGSVKWINSSTLITLEADDGDDNHDSGVNSTFYRVSLVGDDACWDPEQNCIPNQQVVVGDDLHLVNQLPMDWDTYADPFNIPEESCHLIEYFSVDQVEKAEWPKWQCVFVDNSSPIIAKDISGSQHDCTHDEFVSYGEPDFGCHYINQNTTIYLNCVDEGDHPVDNVTLYYRKYLIGDTAPDYTEVPGGYVDFQYTEDSEHKVEFYCVDALGNSNGTADNPHVEVDIVDSKAPLMNKTIGQPSRLVDPGCDPLTEVCDYYITQDTPITFNCTDLDPHPSDHVKMFVDVFWKETEEDDFPVEPDHSFEIDAENWTFKPHKDSIHKLEYWCEDVLDNKAAKQEEIDIVDTQEPEIWKEVGEPSELVDTECDPDEEPCDYFVTTETNITLRCVDPDPHPVDDVEIHWRWQNEVDNTAGGGAIMAESYTFNYPTDSEHKLWFWCNDALGNTAGNDDEVYETDYVDTVPPVSHKTIMGPQYYDEAEDKLYIDGVTRINLTCYDPDPHPVDDVSIFYRYKVDEGDGYGDWTDWFEYNEPFGFPEESKHKLEWYCIDALDNEEEHQFEIDYVDHTPPTTTKTYGDPFIKNDGVKWINSSTLITLEADDGDDNHDSGVNDTWYRVALVDDENCWEECDPEIEQDEEDEIIGKLDWSEEDNNPYWSPAPYSSSYDPSTIGAEVAKGFDSNRKYEFAIPLSELGRSVGDDIKLGAYTLDGKHKEHHRIANHRPSTNQPSFPWFDTSNWEPYTLTDDGTPISVDGDLSDWDSGSLLFTECDALQQLNGEPDDPINRCFDLYATVYDGMLYVGIDYTDDTTDDTPDTNTDGAKVLFAVTPQLITWELYEDPFSIDEESCHVIEYYSRDFVNKTEDLKKQCVFVDNTPPKVHKSVTEPKVSCESIGQSGECDWWITQDTTITLDCADIEQDHPVDDVTLYWRDYREGEAVPGFTEVPGGYAEIQKEEDCKHYLEWYCVDALGNSLGSSEEPIVEIDNVDTEPPVIDKYVRIDHGDGYGDRVYSQEGEEITLGMGAGDRGLFCAEVTDIKQTEDPGVGVDTVWARFSLLDDPELTWNEEEQAYCYERIADDNCGRWHYEVKANDSLGNEAEWTDGIIVVVDNVPPVGEVLNPHAGDYFRDERPFKIYAPAVDFGGDHCSFGCWGGQEDCPPSGVDYCDFYAIDYDFEGMNQSEIKNCYMDLFKYFQQIGEDPYTVYLGRVPYEEGVCKGSVALPAESNLTDTVFLGVKWVDKAGNGAHNLQLALNPWFSPITMNIDNEGPGIFITDSNLPGPLTSGDVVMVDAEVDEYESGFDECWADIYTDDEGSPGENTGMDISGEAVGFDECKISGILPDGIESGNYWLQVHARDEEFNIGTASIFMIVDNTRPTMSVVLPLQDQVYNSLIPVSLHIEDSQSPIADETAMVRIFEIAGLQNAWCLGGCDDTGWLPLTEFDESDLYTGIINLSDYGIDGSGRYAMDAIACDNLYTPDEDPDNPVGIDLNEDRNSRHCKMISEHGVSEEPRPQCNDGIDNDFDGDIDYLNDFACSDSEDDDESDDPFCGDGEVNQLTEECDDGNNIDGDGCSSECLVEEEECSPKTYTIDADFDEGTLQGLEYDSVPDQLQVEFGEVTTFPTLWVANSGDPSLSKWDTESNKELARYQTYFGTLGSFGSHNGPAPSRTAVDVEGNVFVSNRHFPSNKPADVIKVLANDYIDRNGNGVMDTSYDANDDGEITPDEMMPLYDNNSNGVIDEDEIMDERIAWVVEVGTDNCLGRSMALDTNGDIWLGCYNEQAYYKIDGDDGSLLAGPIDVSPHTPYGAVVDNDGMLWGASLTTNLLKLNTNTNAVEDIFYHSAYGGNYGITLDYDDNGDPQIYLGSWGGHTYIQFNSSDETFSTPAEIKYTVRGIATDIDGNIVCGSGGGVVSSGGVAKFAPNGSLIWQAAPQVNGEARGTVVDANNDVWLVHVSNDKLSKFDGTDGSPLGTFDTGKNPYTYSDATGLGLQRSTSSGKWNVVYNSGVENNVWGSLDWNADLPEGTEIVVKVRSSHDAAVWSSWETVDDEVPLSSTPDGRYLEVQVLMQVLEGEVSPVLYDLTIECPVIA